MLFLIHVIYIVKSETAGWLVSQPAGGGAVRAVYYHSLHISLRKKMRALTKLPLNYFQKDVVL